MIISWAHNELAADISPLDTSLSIRFRRPAGASDSIDFAIDQEVMRAATWGAYAQLTNSTVSGVRRGVRGTVPKRHFAGDDIWARHDLSNVDVLTLQNAGTALTDALPAGTVYAVTSDGSGGMYIAGSLPFLGDGPIFHYDCNGAVQSGFLPFVTGGAEAVHALLRLPNGHVVVGGDFTTLAGVACDNLGVVDDKGVFVQDLSLTNSNGVVYALATDGTYLFVGGDLVSPSDSGLIKYEIATWTRLPYDLSTVGAIVYDLLIDGNTLYCVGDFTTVLGTTIARGNGVALKIDTNISLGSNPTQAYAAILPWDPQADDIVWCIAGNEDHIYLGGDFGNLALDALPGLGRVDPVSGAVDGTWVPAAINGVVNDIALTDTHVIAVGAFTAPTGRAGAFAISDASAATWNPAANATVRKVFISGNRVHIAGAFTNIGVPAINGYSIHPDVNIISQTGKYKLEYVDEGNIADPILNVRFTIDGIIDEVVTEYERSRDGLRYTTDPFILTAVATNYKATIRVERESGITVHTTVLGSGTTQEVVILRDSDEVGYQFPEGTVFDAPTIIKSGNTYSITPNSDISGSPVVQDTDVVYRVWILVAAASSAITVVRTTFDGNVVNTTIPSTRYYSGTHILPTAGDTNLTVDGRTGVASVVAAGPIAQTVAAATGDVNADQQQIECEGADGAWRGRIISDWNALGVVDVSNIGPAADQFRFRYRYRAFSYTTTGDETGKPVRVSGWSAWSPLT